MTVIKQDSNTTSLHFAEEATPGVLPGSPVWYALEPNSYSDFGSSIKTTTRSPITATRQKKKGGVSDLDAVGGFGHDFTQTNLQRLLQGFVYADALEKPDTKPFNGTAVTLTAIATSDDSFAAASGLDVFLPGHLVLSSGCALSANNGLKTVVSAIATKVVVSQNLSDETPTTAARLEAVGFQFASGDLTITANSTDIIIGCTAADFTDFDLNVGEWIFIGGDSASTKFATCPTGYGRIKSITATSISLDETTFTAVTDAGTSKTVQMFFGKSLKNASVAANVVRRTYQLERQLGSDDNGVQSEYLIGAAPNDLSIKVPLAGNVETDLSFVGNNTEYRNGTTGIKTGDRVNSVVESAYNTTRETFRSQMSIVSSTLNGSPLFAYITEMNINIKNNVSPIKAIGVLGSIGNSLGDFEVSGSITAYFTTIAAVEEIQDDPDISMNLIMASVNQGFVIDMPLVSLSEAKITIEKDKPVTIPLNSSAFECALGHTMVFTFFNYLPTVAMPV